MKLKTIKYQDYLKQIPQKGHHILAQQTEDKILVYQAYNPSIANYALEHQRFGGKYYSYSRMSWIKPNFLWMMYRCGWAQKKDQDRVLGIWLKKSDFDIILGEAVYSSFQPDAYQTRENWKEELADKEVRLQWDPDHDVYGEKQERRAIQLGIKGKLLHEFGTEMIVEIIDMTPFVKAQKLLIDTNQLSELLTPSESTYKSNDPALNQQLRIN